MNIGNQRFENLLKFKWKCAQDLGINEADVTDKVFAEWLEYDPKYYSNWKNGNKNMSASSARKVEKLIGIPINTLDVLQIDEDIFFDFMIECFKKVRNYMIENSISDITPERESKLSEQIYLDGKKKGLRIDQNLFTSLTSII